MTGQLASCVRRRGKFAGIKKKKKKTQVLRETSRPLCHRHRKRLQILLFHTNCGSSSCSSISSSDCRRLQGDTGGIGTNHSCPDQPAATSCLLSNTRRTLNFISSDFFCLFILLLNAVSSLEKSCFKLLIYVYTLSICRCLRMHLFN